MKTWFLFVISLWQLISSSPDLEPGKFVVFTQEDSFYIVNKDGFFRTTDGSEWFFLASEVPFKKFDYKYLELNGVPHIMSASLGEVYFFENDILKRIDNSFDFKAFYDASLFEYKNEIHAFGGYGLFTHKNTLLHFDTNAQEWFQKNYALNSPRPKPRSLASAQHADNYLYIGMGVEYPAELNGIDFHQDFWKLDLEKKSWEMLGKFNDQYVSPDFPSDRYNLFIFSQHNPPLYINSTKAYGIDIVQNTLTEYHGPSVSMLQDIQDMYYNHRSDKLLIVQSNNSEDMKLIVKVINSKTFLGDSKVYTPLFIAPPLFDNWQLGAFGLAVFGLFILFIILLRNKRKSSRKSIEIHSLKDKLPKAEWDILTIILKNHPEPTAYPEILNYFEPKLTYESRIKKLRVSLENLNTSLRTIYGPHKDFIISQKNKDDRRVKEVYYNE